MGVAAVLLVASMALSVGGGIVKGRAALKQSEAEQKAAEFNAQQAKLTASAEEDRIRRAARRKLSKQRVSIAKAGVTIEGTPLSLLAQNAAEFELDALNARRAGQVTAFLEGQRARSARKRGTRQAGASLLSGITSAVGTGSTFAGGGKTKAKSAST